MAMTAQSELDVGLKIQTAIANRGFARRVNKGNAPAWRLSPKGKMEFFTTMVRGTVRNRYGVVAFFALTVLSQSNPISRCMATELGSNVPGAIPSKIDTAIDRLDSMTFQERETATRELLNGGSTAIPHLEAALQNAKGEVRYRIRSILDSQRRSSDMITRRAAEQAIGRIASSKDQASAQWARSISIPPAAPSPSPYAQQSAAKKQG